MSEINERGGRPCHMGLLAVLNVVQLYFSKRGKIRTMYKKLYLSNPATDLAKPVLELVGQQASTHVS